MKLYNTLSRQVEDFQPLNDKQVNMFTCGPTVYDYLHIGNGRTAVTMDVLARILRFSGYNVTFLANITDIDDKIINRANELNEDWSELSRKFEDQYKADMQNLDVRVDIYARATDHIADIIKQVQALLEKGFAYTTSDGVYFEIAKFDGYGKLSGRTDIKKDDAMSRIDESDEKRGWNDFALWKFKKEGEPSWPAPFGDGRPGWHIEDTAITEHFFGPQYDIHGGGSDLIFPHHEAEITQMESASGKIPFVKYWVHGGLLYINDQRMGKSNNNFITIKDATDKYTASQIRLLFLQGHYRSQLNFSDDLMKSGVARLQRWQSVVDQRWQINENANDIVEQIEKLIKSFIEHLQNDLDTPNAIVDIESAIDIIEKNGVNNAGVEVINKFISTIYDTLGINLSSDDISDAQKELMTQRDEAKANKDYALADELRDKLLNDGLELKDTNHGTLWSRVA